MSAAAAAAVQIASESARDLQRIPSLEVRYADVPANVADATLTASRNKYRLHCFQSAKLVSKEDWDWWSAWTGGEGVGKSTGMFWRAYYVQEYLAQKNGTSNHFLRNWRELVVYDAEAFLDAVDRAKKGTSICLDEAAEVWFYKEWYNDIHRALDKAAVQMRDRNLDINLASPVLGYLGKVAIARVKDWDHITAPGFRRGFHEMLQPNWSKFGNYKLPYFQTKINHRFQPLPISFYGEYRVFKRKAAEERLAHYIEAASGRNQDLLQRPFREQVDDVITRVAKFENQAQLKNRSGRYDFGLICYEFNSSIEVARAAVKVMARDQPDAPDLPPSPAGRIAPRRVDGGA